MPQPKSLQPLLEVGLHTLRLAFWQPKPSFPPLAVWRLMPRATYSLQIPDCRLSCAWIGTHKTSPLLQAILRWDGGSQATAAQLRPPSWALPRFLAEWTSL